MADPSTQFGSAVILALNPAGLGFKTPRCAFLSGSAAAFQAAYFDTNGNPFIPTSITYQIDDVSSGKEILGPLGLPVGTGNLIVVTAAQNAMVSVSRSRESHLLTLNISSVIPGGTIDTDAETIDSTTQLIASAAGSAVYRRTVLFDIVRAP